MNSCHKLLRCCAHSCACVFLHAVFAHSDAGLIKEVEEAEGESFLGELPSQGEAEGNKVLVGNAAFVEELCNEFQEVYTANGVQQLDGGDVRQWNALYEVL